jgi:hypothetical protein
MPGGYVVRDANGQALAYVYSRENEDEARQAKVLTKDRPGGRHQHRAVAGAAWENGSRHLTRLLMAELLPASRRWRTPAFDAQAIDDVGERPLAGPSDMRCSELTARSPNHPTLTISTARPSAGRVTGSKIHVAIDVRSGECSLFWSRHGGLVCPARRLCTCRAGPFSELVNRGEAEDGNGYRAGILARSVRHGRASEDAAASGTSPE